MAPLKVTRGQIYKAIYNVSGLQPSAAVKARLLGLIPQQIRRNPSPKDYPDDADGRIRREYAFTMAREIITQFDLTNVTPQKIKVRLEDEGYITGAKHKNGQKDYFIATKQASTYLAKLMRAREEVCYLDMVSELTDELLNIPAEMRQDAATWNRAIMEIFKNTIHRLGMSSVNIYRYEKESGMVQSLVRDKLPEASRYDLYRKDILPGEKRHFVTLGQDSWFIEDRKKIAGMSEEDKKWTEDDLEMDLNRYFGENYQDDYVNRIRKIKQAIRENVYFRIDVSDAYSLIVLANNHLSNAQLIKDGKDPLPLFANKEQRHLVFKSLRRMGARIKSTLRSAKLLRANELNLERANLIHELHTMLDKITDISLLYSKVIDELPNQFRREGQPIKVRSRSLMLFDQEAEVLRFTESSGVNRKDRTLKSGQGVAGYVFATGEPIIVDDAAVAEIPQIKPQRSLKKGSFMSVPIKIADQTLGVLNIHCEEKNIFTIHDKKHFMTIARILADKIYITRLIDYDGMTGLYYHTQGLQRLHRMLLQEKPLSVIMFDIDHFKHTNDTYGHPVGDKVLKQLTQTARRLLGRKKSESEENIGIRYGGEEFVLAFQGISKTQAALIAEELRAEIEAQLFELGDDRVIQKTISLGVAEFPGDGKTVKELIQSADSALYRSKNSGRNRVTVF